MKENPDRGTDALYELAVKALARRARSSAEVRLLLEKKEASRKQIEAVLRRLRENGYLDDARFARHLASARLENDLQGKARVRRDLRGRGVKEEIAQDAIGQAYQNIDEGELLRRYLKRRVNISQAFSRSSTLVSLFRRLLRAGFASDTIVQELRKILQSPLVKGRLAGISGIESPTLDETLDSLSEFHGAEDELDQ